MILFSPFRATASVLALLASGGSRSDNGAVGGPPRPPRTPRSSPWAGCATGRVAASATALRRLVVAAPQSDGTRITAISDEGIWMTARRHDKEAS